MTRQRLFDFTDAHNTGVMPKNHRFVFMHNAVLCITLLFVPWQTKAATACLPASSNICFFRMLVFCCWRCVAFSGIFLKDKLSFCPLLGCVFQCIPLSFFCLFNTRCVSPIFVSSAVHICHHQLYSSGGPPKRPSACKD